MRSELTARTEEAPPRMLGVPGRAARRTLTVPGRAACRTFTLVAALTLLGAAPAHAALNCPEGTSLIGDAPPQGTRQWCAYRDQEGRLAYHGPYSAWHDNGVLKLTGSFDRGLRIGLWIEYDEAGQEVVASTYRGDVLEGPYRGKTTDGGRAEGAYKAGKRDGAWRLFDKVGAKSAEGTFKNGLRHGRWTYFYEDGSRSEGPFVDDVRTGRWTAFGPNGQRRAEGPVVNGRRQGPWLEFDDQGVLVAKGPYVDDARSGRWVILFAGGRTQATGDYLAGQKSGVWTEWQPDGTRWEGHFRGGLKDGVWASYAPGPNGGMTGRGEMREGRMSGEWSLFDDRGALVAKGPYVDGKRHGTWIEVAKDGGRFEGEYRDGERDGTWIAYDLAGMSRGELSYARGLRRDGQVPVAPTSPGARTTP